MSHFIWRLLRAGLAAALVVGASGWAIERAQFGPTDQTALSRVEAELRQRLDANVDSLGTIAAAVASRRDIIRGASAATRDVAAARQLFDLVDAALPDDVADPFGISVYDAAAAPLAWAGAVSDLPKERVNGPAALLIIPGSFRPHLIRIEPVAGDGSRGAPRVATIVVEQSLGRTQGAPGLPDTFVVPTSLVPVALRVRAPLDRESPGAGPPRSENSQYTLMIPSRGSELLVEADVAPDDLAAARERWRAGTWAAVVSVLAITLLLCTAPLLELRQRTRDPRTFLIATVVLASTFVVARAVFWFAARLVLGPRPLTSPAELLLTSLVAAALVWLTLDAVERRRVTRPRPRLLPWRLDAGSVRLIFVYLAAGLIDAWLVAWYRGLPAERRVDHRARRASFLVASDERHSARGRFRFRAAPRGRHLGRSHHDPSGRNPGPHAAQVAGRARGSRRVARRPCRRHRRRAACGAGRARGAARCRVRHRRGLRVGAREAARQSPARVAGRAARRVVPRAAGPGDGDVPVAVRLCDRRERASDRERIRTAGGAPA